MYEIQVTGFKDIPDIHVGADTVFVDQHDGELAVFTDQADATRFRASQEMLESLLAVQKYFLDVSNGDDFAYSAEQIEENVMRAIKNATARRCACGAPFVRQDEIVEHCVGHLPDGPPGHDHNDNCLTRDYFCANGHVTYFSLRRSCPVCSWRGKASCHCNPREKVERWPEIEAPTIPSS